MLFRDLIERGKINFTQYHLFNSKNRTLYTYISDEKIEMIEVYADREVLEYEMFINIYRDTYKLGLIVTLED